MYSKKKEKISWVYLFYINIDTYTFVFLVYIGLTDSNGERRGIESNNSTEEESSLVVDATQEFNENLNKSDLISYVHLYCLL